MRAYHLRGPGQIVPVTVTEPKPKADEVLLQTEAVSICSTDVSYFRGHLRPDAWPVIPGHEFVGTVLEVGAEVADDVAPGDRLVYWGQSDFGGLAERRCIRPVFVGAIEEPRGRWFTRRGFCDASECAAARVPGSLPAATATLCEPLTSVMRSLLHSPCRPGDHVVVLGAGPSGLLAMQVLKKHLAASAVTALDHDPARLARARAMGADHVYDPVAQVDALQELVARTEGMAADVVFDALPHVAADSIGRSTRSLAADLLRPGGAYVVYGATEEPQSFDLWRVLAKGLNVHGAPFDVRCFPMNRAACVLDLAVRLIDMRAISTTGIVTKSVDAIDTEEVISAFADYGKAGAMKTSIRWAQEQPDICALGNGASPLDAHLADMNA